MFYTRKLVSSSTVLSNNIQNSWGHNFALKDLDTLSYTFDHIWTNLLTQCTLVPVSVFCCFFIPCFPHIKSAPKIREKSDKKSAQQKPPEPQSTTRKGPYSGVLFLPLVAHFKCATKDKPLIRP